ncbi:MAG: sodium:proton antiporter [Lachnospiraceae bacterium]|nr:sodium:proton antiporter [Lachnospiraceae bacterium]
MTLDMFTDKVYSVVLVILAIMVLVCLFRAVIGPRVPDRIVSVNMMGTMVMVIIAILAVKNNEGYLADICVLYAMISFLAVVVLCKVYLGVYLEKKKTDDKKKEETEDGDH